MTLQNIRLLRNVINESLQVIETAYQAENLDFPSLDKPVYTGITSLNDDPAEALTTSPNVAEAIDLVVSACYQLLNTVRHPFASVADVTCAYHLPACLRVAEKLNISEVLREAGDDGLHVEALGTKVNMEPSKLGRILRLLATHHIYRELKPNVFVNNRLSATIDTGNPSSLLSENPSVKYDSSSRSAVAGYVGTFTDDVFKASAYLLENLENNETSRGFDADKAAFQAAFRTRQNYFNWLENVDNSYRLKRYGACIQGTSLWDSPESILLGFPWDSITEDSMVVDVGGGLGAPAMVLARNHPHLHLIVQDREIVVVQAIEQWKKSFPEALDSERVKFQVHDFFNDQPVKSPAVFLLRTICHDWPDELSIKILANLRSAAADNTRVILAEYIMPHACSTTAPPLLDNLGKTSFNPYFIDMTMQVLLNGQERTIDHYRHIMSSAGWTMVNVKRIPNSHFGFMIGEPSKI